MKLSPTSVFRSDYLWTWLAAFFSLVVCAMLSYLRVEQSKTILEAASTIQNIGQARLDLNEGFLHLTLAGEPQSPFRREEGLALIDQAITTLQEAKEQGIAGRSLKADPNVPWSDFEKTAAAFRSELAAWKRTSESGRGGMALPMHLSFHRMEQYASQIDDLGHAKLAEINSSLSGTFLISIGISTALLCGICMGVYWAARNQRIAVQAMRQSEERLRILGDNLPNGYIFQFQQQADGSAKFPYVSAGVEQVNGIKAADCMRDGSLLLNQMDSGQLGIYADAVSRSARDLSNFDTDLSFQHANGQERVARIHSHPVADSRGEITWYGMTLDVTEHRRAEAKIRKNEQLLLEMGRAAKMGGWEFDVATGGGEWTEETARIHDLDPSVNPTWEMELGFFKGESRSRLEAAIEGAVEEGVPYDLDLEIVSDKGTHKWVRTIGIPVFENGRAVRVRGSMQDITLRKQNELEIERLTRLYSTLSEVNQAIVRCRDRDGLFEQISQVMIEFGKFRAVWVGMQNGEDNSLTAVARQISGEAGTGDAADLACAGTIGEMIRTGQPAICSNRLIACNACCRKSLAQMDVLSCATFPLRLHQKVMGAFTLFSNEASFFNAGEVRLLNEIAEDISYALDRIDEREQQRQVQEERLRITTAMEQAAELIVITDVAGSILYVNPAFEKVTGYSREEVLGKNPRILKSGKADEAYYRSMWAALIQGNVWHGRIVNRKKNGDLYEEDATISPIRNPSGKIVNYVGVKRDITREVELEAQFRQAQKLDGIGQLAGGVAHDFNNILGAIMLQAQMTENTPGLSCEAAEGMRQIQRSCERGANLTRQLLLFSRKQEMQAQDLDLNEIVTNMTKMLQRIIGGNISMQLRLHSRPLIARVDAGMIDQVILNLAINGRDAMDHHGQLTIETFEKSVDQEAASLNQDAAPGTYACLAISDTGCGIAPEILPRIYEPFFTTKEQGKGTGLGLATVFGIVKQHKGWIEVKTGQGKGTTFEVYLPLGKTVSKLESSKAVSSGRLGGSETILLAEDDADVRKITSKFLERHGYHVMEAGNGVEALELWEKCGGKVDLLLTDLLMPDGVNGHELAQRLHAANPELKIIYISGYSADLAGRGLELHTGENFLQKPVMPDQLLRLVRRQFAS